MALRLMDALLLRELEISVPSAGEERSFVSLHRSWSTADCVEETFRSRTRGKAEQAVDECVVVGGTGAGTNERKGTDACHGATSSPA